MKKLAFISLFLLLLLSSLMGGQWSIANAQGTIPNPVGIIPVTGASTIITAGLGHTCMSDETGRVLCWGLNSSGQVGDGTFTNKLIPVYVKYLTGVVDLTAGSLHNCALTKDGKIWCWGDNSYGQLGNGSSDNSNIPIMVKDLSGKVTHLTGGEFFTCAQLESKEVFCWGKNDVGQLNGGTSKNSLTPGKANLNKVQTNISGGQATLLGESYGDVAQWNDMEGIEVIDLALSMSISANRFAPGGCAVTSDGVVECWSSDLMSTGIDKAPLALLVGTGMDHGCAIDIDFSVFCWGENSYGELGNGTLVSNSQAKIVSDLSGVSALGVGAHHSCVLLGDGSGAKCWGSNNYGQLGNNSTTDSSIPVLVYPPAQ